MFDFLEERENEYNAVVDKLQLPEFVKNLPYTLLGKPYHNSHHIRSVALKAHFIGKEEGLSDENLTVAFVAGICHDLQYVDHHQEYQNIQNAIDTFNDTAVLLNFTQDQIHYGRGLILNTDSSIDKEYDGSPSDQWIVHDADMAIWVGIGREEAEYLYQGIENELCIPTCPESTLAFLNHESMGTYTGKKMLAKFNAESKYGTDSRWIQNF